MSRMLVAGATSEALRPFLLRAAARGTSFALIGRDALAVAHLESALRDAGAPLISCFIVGPDPTPAAITAAVTDAATAGPFDYAIDATGSLAPEEAVSADPELRARLIRANHLLPMAFVRAALGHLRPGGAIAVAGSVASIKPRRSLRTYGEAKAALARDIASIDHGAVRLIELRFGPLRTRMHPGGRGRAPIDPARLAPAIDDALLRRSGVVYLPPIWRVIGALLARLPQWVIDRIR
jgi:short-subunit dehydrogenase